MAATDGVDDSHHGVLPGVDEERAEASGRRLLGLDAGWCTATGLSQALLARPSATASPIELADDRAQGGWREARLAAGPRGLDDLWVDDWIHLSAGEPGYLSFADYVRLRVNHPDHWALADGFRLEAAGEDRGAI